MWTLRIALFIQFFAMAIVLPGCLEDQSSGSESGSTVVTDPTPIPPTGPPADPTRTLCDPFQTNSPQARDRGLVGNLLYLTDLQPRYGSVSEVIDNGVVVPATIYLDRLYVPTRPFDRGFFTKSGQPITTIDGNFLYEYFALRMESQLQLAPGEPEGDYQLAVLADDGAIMKINDDGSGYRVIVDNDGTHPTRMACATQTIHMTSTTKIPMIMDYYQGPRYHISLVAMWRPITGATPLHDDFCDQAGNDLFFDSTKNPVESTDNFLELLARDWKVLENGNYYFPQQADNPCVPAELPLSVTFVRVDAITRNSVTLSWTTNIPSTSQVIAHSTGVADIVTAIDPNLVTNHTMVITGLSPLTLYSIRGISTTPGGQTALSDEKGLRTSR